MKALKKNLCALPKQLLRFSLVGMVLLSLIWFALQAFALRDPDRYRPQLIELFQHTTGLDISIGSIEHAPWAFQPGVLLKGIVVLNEQHQPILSVPSLEARLSLLNLFKARLDFSRLKIVVDEVDVDRDKQGQWYLSTLPISKSNSEKNPFLHWLIEQGHCNLTVKKLVFRDKMTAQPTYLFREIHVELKNSLSQHWIKGTVLPDPYFGEAMSIEGALYGNQSSNLSAWHGQLKWSTHHFNLTSLTPWFASLHPLKKGYGSFNAVFSLREHFQIGIDTDIDLYNLKGRFDQALHDFDVDQLQGHLSFNQLEKGFDLTVRELAVRGNSSIKISHPLNLTLLINNSFNRFTAKELVINDIHNNIDQLPMTESQRHFWYKLGMQGDVNHINISWQGDLTVPQQYQASLDLDRFGLNPYQSFPAIHDFTGHIDLRNDGGAVKGQGSSLTLNYPQIFPYPNYIDQYTVDINWLHNADQVILSINNINVSNADLSGDFSGSMEFNATTPKQTHLHGKLQRANLNAIWRYMPLTVNKDTRDWLKTGLVKGFTKEVNFNLDGDLQQFPFATDQIGKFTVNATVFDAQVNFNNKWPIIDHVAGDFYIKEAALGFKAKAGTILNNQINNVMISIPDLVHGNEVLFVDGSIHTSVKEALNFIKNSPVSGYINHVADSLVGSGLGELSLKLQIPLIHSVDTTLRGDFQFIDATLDDGNKSIPPVNALNGHLRFTESGLDSDRLTASILGGEASLIFSTDSNKNTVLKAQGVADASQLYGVYGNSLLKKVSGQSNWTALFKFNKNKTDILLDSTALLVGEPVGIHLSTRSDGLIDLALLGNTSMKSLNVLFPNPLWASLDSSVNWNGHILLSKKYDDISFSLAALVLKKPVFMTVKGSLSNLIIADMSGHSDIPSLSRLGLNKINSLCRGTFAWHGRFEKRDTVTTIVFTSNLKGVSIDGPGEYQKTSTQSLPVTLIIEPLESGKTQMSLNVDSWFGTKIIYESQSDGSFNATRGVVNLGGPYLGQVGPGFSVMGQLENSNIDDLTSFWDSHANQWQSPINENQKKKVAATNNMFGSVNNIDVTVNNVVWRKRTWLKHRLQASWLKHQWSVSIQGVQVNGSINWDKENQGFIKANFSQLVIPDTISQQEKDNSPGPKTTKKVLPSNLANLDDLKEMPDIDLIAEHCQFGKKKLSHVEFAAQRQENAWHISRFFANTEGGEIQGTGQWLGSGGEQTKTEIKLAIDAKNYGNLLKAMGYNNLMARGDGIINANLSWSGGPKDYDFDYASGTMNVDLHDGQFSKVDPGGAGRIIGLFSLQSLPRRITLDFHDIFSQGFAFDTVKGEFIIKEGVLNTPDFVMSGPAARVKLKGLIDFTQETSDLKVKVDPAVGGDVSLAGALIGGPVVGAAAYLVQKILRNPLDKVLSYEYRIYGSWDNPQVDTVDTNFDATEKAVN
ncbi:MAG: DUF3971 domain-containing protein [Ferrovum sp. 37-45-19]|uniref:YhdP family phospholipid transporter n=1 Tax=Ferrovum sp. JA12 TaxID=1356299 RepID=UPI00070261E2|nr:AsmA-like C-terminal region-containing protein [Ferrovum sp. JA12]OYV80184.1 MAG: DUF3971 domain-containing protein [Ferrovum sp. 21-44-67]OYV94461.1 MAG: DUF3971 domain-containing protein [Ferrovum sp. 37-45-19]OZB32443.1 MAG: DUF3971 domain-containing protein [Ferrovum sp. 34-44-207]HQT81642.1 DUF3971 domain-containing protein [Ferrovaceae bacterium]KRH78863.1 hypothetical protein FERRO_18610 [Ferrovum sp. JA12]